MPPKKIKAEAIPIEAEIPVQNVEQNKKPTVAVKGTLNDSDRLQLAQAINNLAVKSDSFISALAELSKFDKERLQSIDIQLESKKKEFQDETERLQYDYSKLKTNLENEHADAKIKFQQNLQIHKMDTINKFCNELNLSLIEKDKLQSLRDELEQLKEKYADEKEEALNQEKTRSKNELTNSVKTLQLEHKAEIASLSSQVNQQVKEIEVLNNTIESLKSELREQRQLTKEVAQAASKSQISQSFAK
jgi:hypothetical protein